MPELPDVTVYLEALAARVNGRKLLGVRLASPFVLRTFDPPLSAAAGKKVLGLRRVGKRLVLALEGDLFLVMHLMIAGRLKWLDAGAKIPGKVGLAAFDFDSGTVVLTEVASKKRASIHLLRGEEAVREMDRGGIEPLEATLASFREALLRENHTLKRSLTDPRLFSGIGNAYSDEILHRARLSPVQTTHKLDDAQISRLYQATQAAPLAGWNLFESDLPLQEAMAREGAGWARERAASLGTYLGTAEAQRLAAEANEFPPKLRTHDRYGNRLDEVEFHPAWHALLGNAVARGIHALPWQEPRPGAHAARAVLMLLDSQNEAGHGCPVSMTYSCVPALRRTPALAREWEPRVASAEYEPRLLPAAQKRSALVGMAMTEKQGGSDVRANTTRAEAAGGAYRLTGHKWFCSAPMSDAFLVLAQASKGLSCFLLPRVLPDGTKNGFRLQRLKDKLGNRSNASSEVEFDSAFAHLVGEEGRGLPAILAMVTHTRLESA